MCQYQRTGMSCKKKQKRIQIRDFMCRGTPNVENEKYD